MFVAIRDLKFARGRFALMGAVVGLITLMVVLLSGLTAGLGRASVSAITNLPADHLVFAKPADSASISFDDSRIHAATVAAWTTVPGVASAQPLTVKMSRAEMGSSAAAATNAVAVFAIKANSSLPPAAVGAGHAVLSVGAAKALHAEPGDRVTVAGVPLTVTAVAGDDSYSHADVVWMTQSDLAGAQGGTADATTVIALTTHGISSAALAAADSRLNTRTVTTDNALAAIGSYSAENGSLQLMRALLFAISALVVGAFFTVWTVQRSADIAVLKALGSSTGYLLRDALGQALILLIIGTATGTALAAGLGALAGSAVPFVLDASTLLVPAAAMVLLGLLGATVSLRRVTTVDPLTALGSSR
ncbi:MAG: ABC transporter permease [Nakamurella sp.]